MAEQVPPYMLPRTLAEMGRDFDPVPGNAALGAGGSIQNGNALCGIVAAPEYRAMNPIGAVPTFCDGGFTLCESNSLDRNRFRLNQSEPVLLKSAIWR